MKTDDLARSLDAAREVAPDGSGWEHVKTGGLYHVCGHVIRESDLAPCVIYCGLSDDRVWWCRPVAEFLDGRFLRVEELDL